MQKNLPKAILIFLIILITLIISATFLLGRKNKTTTATDRIIVNSTIAPYIAKATPRLEKELENLGFWNRSNRKSNTTPKKITINISYIGPGSLGKSSYSQVDDNGNALVIGSSRLDSNSDPIIDIFLSDKIFALGDPVGWIDSDLWNVIYILDKGPRNPGTNIFISNKLSKGSYFTLEK